jgi:ABC-type multidrug transport system fused ATPase/permease subunit
MDLSPLDIRVIVIVVVAVLLVAGISWIYMRRRKTAALRQKFGSEYNRAVLVHGSERKAEAKLADREKRVEKLNIRDLDSFELARFAKQWESVQARFVDSPKGAVMEADDLVTSLMKTRGYPVADFDQRAADISVDHPKVVENFRNAHETTMRVGRSEATTDELRGAMIHYRALYEELMQVTPPVIVRVAS